MSFPVSRMHAVFGAGLVLFGGFTVAGAQDTTLPKFSQLPEAIKKDALIGMPRSSTEIGESPFGIHTTIMAEGGSDNLIKNTPRLISAAGFKWVVEYLSIGKTADMTPPQVSDKFAALPERCTDYATRLQKSKIKLLMRLDPFPWEPWKGASTAVFEENSPDMERAVVFVRQVVRQLKPYTNHWQAWNEPNIGNQQPLVSPANYVKLVKRLSEVIREEQPDAVIYGPGTAMLQCLDKSPYPWIPMALDAGLTKYINVFSFHPYRAPAWRRNLPENASQFHPWKTWKDYTEQIEDLRARLRKANGGKEVPLATTEDGLSNVIDGNGEQQISWIVGAKYELRRALQDFYLGISPRTLFCFYRNAGERFYEKQGTFNIVTDDFQKKPTYYAAQNLNAVLDSSYQRDDSRPVKITVTGPRQEFLVNDENPGERTTLAAGTSVPTVKVCQQVYRKDHPGYEELLVFYWSAEPSEDCHIRYPAKIEINEPGWVAPLQIDLMAMPVKRPKNEIVELIRSDFVDRRDPLQFQAVRTATGSMVETTELRDYPLLVKWFRPHAQ